MKRLIFMLVPLVLAATPSFAQDAHAGHTMPPAQAADPHAGHTMPPAQLADPHAGHAMPPEPPADPHAGHTMPPAQPDPHAGHTMPPAQPDPHASQTMPPAQPADPHAGHTMPPAQPADPHAGHMMPPAQPDPHAGHGAMGMTPPEMPTSADDVGRHPQAPPPAAAFSGPAHAADAIFGAEAMAAARAQVLQETGAMRTSAFVLERLEAGVGEDATTFLWDAQGWVGGDIHRFAWKTEGEGDFDGGVEAVEVQALYSHAFRPFWDVQVGLRQDIVSDGDDATHLVAGVQGVAPGWWEVDAALFLSTEGDLTARVEAEYDLRLTQRLILQPRVELDLSASDEPARGLSSGFTGAEAGLRLRYEIRREFAPYVGVEWHSALGGAADLARAAGHPVDETRFLIGLRAWF